MYERFEKLNASKQQAILDACISEFADKGYLNASTNAIAQKAGIAKGLLFYYFKNKKNLYLYILEHICTSIKNEIVSGMQQIESEDFFERIKALSVIRISTYGKFSDEYQLLMQAVSYSPEDIKLETETMYLDYYTSLNAEIKKQVYSYFGKVSLKPGVLASDASEFFSLVFDHLTQKYLKLYLGRAAELADNPAPLFSEIDRYIDLIKTGIIAD